MRKLCAVPYQHAAGWLSLHAGTLPCAHSATRLPGLPCALRLLGCCFYWTVWGSTGAPGSPWPSYPKFKLVAAVSWSP